MKTIYAAPLVALALALTACGNGSQSGSQAAPVSITSPSSASASVGSAYSLTLTETGGTAPYSWSLASGTTLPPGLTLNASTGVVSGTPTTAGSYTMTFAVTDSSHPAKTSTLAFSLMVAAAPVTPVSITTPSAASGTVGVAFSQTLVASGGTTPYTWSLGSGSSLPAGLTLNPTTGVISGTPTLSGMTTATVVVSDSSSPAQTASLSLPITIAVPPISITASAAPSGTAGTAYSYTLAAGGGTAPYTWSVTSGPLPTGLTLNSSTGVISGTPTAPASTLVSVKVTDSSTPMQTATASFTLTIAPAPLAILTTTLPSDMVGTVYSQTLAVSGGVAPYTWSVPTGYPPSGLTLGAGTGILGGTPNTAGTTVFTVKVTDSAGHVATQQLSFTATPTPLTGNALLNGHYFVKIDSFGDATAIADHETYIGSLVLNGSGAITSGVMDYSDDADVQTTLRTITGSYVINGDGRGTLTINDGLGSAMTFAIAVGVAPQGSPAQRARFVETSQSVALSNGGIDYGTGFLQMQDPSAFTSSSLAGNRVFGWSGDTELYANAPALLQQGGLSAAGLLVVDSSTLNLDSGSTADLATNQATDSNVPLVGGLVTDTTPVAASTAFAQYGRAVLNLTSTTYTDGQLPAGTAVYIIDANTAYVLSSPQTTGDPLYSGYLVSQTGSFTNSSLHGSVVAYGSGQSVGSMADYSGMGTTTLYGTSQALLTLYTADGGGNYTAISDANSAGSITAAASSNGTYSVTPTGRVTFNGAGGLVLWLTGPNSGFAITQPTASGPWPMLLNVEQQTATPYANASFTGNYLLGDQQLSSYLAAMFSGELQSDGAGNITATADFFSDGIGAAQDYGPTGLTASTSTAVGANGRFVLSPNYTLGGSPTINEGLVFYMISPNKAVGIDTTPADISPAIVVLEQAP